jgi:hypothetical protein
MKIIIHNARSQLLAQPDVITWLQPRIAYRVQNLPPVAVQKVIKGFMARPADAYEARKAQAGEPYRYASRQGPERDLALLLENKRVQLAALDGWDNRLTTNTFEAALRLRGFWDGWETLISSGGWFGTGLVPYVQRAITLHMGRQVDLDDQRGGPPAPSGVWSQYKPSLYPFQQEAIDAWRNHGFRGVVDSPPRTGKTRIAMGAIAEIGLPALIVVPRINLVTQTVEAFAKFFPPGSVVGVTGGKPNARLKRQMNRALVWVATPPTAAGPKDSEGKRTGIDGIRTRRILVIDEFHHAAATTYQSISESAENA